MPELFRARIWETYYFKHSLAFVKERFLNHVQMSEENEDFLMTNNLIPPFVRTVQ